MLYIYGKPGCSRCEVLKRQLKAANIPFEYFTQDVDYNSEWLKTQIPKSSRQLPVVFEEDNTHNRKYVNEDRVNKMLIGKFTDDNIENAENLNKEIFQ